MMRRDECATEGRPLRDGTASSAPPRDDCPTPGPCEAQGKTPTGRDRSRATDGAGRSTSFPAVPVRLPPRPDADPTAWFTAVADVLLNRAELVAVGAPLRVAEVEFYLKSADHPDPFAHAHAVQRHWGKWYFHRSGGSYRGGSFKGLDLALGAESAAVGVLLRAVVTPDGAIIDGPSRLVDYLLQLTGTATAAELDAQLPDAFDTTLPVHFRAAPDRRAAVLATARVGLSLKRATAHPAMPRFVGLRYRFLTEPRRIHPGRPQLVTALHRDGMGAKEIRERTGTAAGAIARYAAAFEEGGAEHDFVRYAGVDLTPVERCRLLGTWEAVYGGFGRA